MLLQWERCKRCLDGRCCVKSHGALVGGWRDLSCCRCTLHILQTASDLFRKSPSLQKPKCFHTLDRNGGLIISRLSTSPLPCYVLLSLRCCWRVAMTSQIGRLNRVMFNAFIIKRLSAKKKHPYKV